MGVVTVGGFEGSDIMILRFSFENLSVVFYGGIMGGWRTRMDSCFASVKEFVLFFSCVGFLFLFFFFASNFVRRGAASGSVPGCLSNVLLVLLLVLLTWQRT